MTPVWDIIGKRVLVLGAGGLVGSALMCRSAREDCHVIGAFREDADLRDPAATAALVARAEPDAIILAAAKVGGILANRDNPTAFLEDNLLIQLNVMRAAHAENVDRFLFLGSSCIYPKHAQQPITENSLMTGPLEPTNAGYAIAKIAGIQLVDSYRGQYGRQWISAMPTNLYGPHDNFDLETSHVLPALLRRFHEAKKRAVSSVEIWGTGKARREFLHVEDCADALMHLLAYYDESGPINVGTGRDVSILELAELISELTGFSGNITHDLTKPDGMAAKRLDVSRLAALGWESHIDLRTGLARVYDWYVENAA